MKGKAIVSDGRRERFRRSNPSGESLLENIEDQLRGRLIGCVIAAPREVSATFVSLA